jgi:hypothetical protein
MRWFRTAFEAYVKAIGGRIGCTYKIDDAKLAVIFVRWLRAVELQKPSRSQDRHDYFEFAAGLMLRELTVDMPLIALAPPSKCLADSAATFWPEGYACTMFCLTVHSAAMEQEFKDKPQVSPVIEDLRHWWSFKENAQMEASFSVGFLLTLLGHQPNWMMPDVFRVRLRDELKQP